MERLLSTGPAGEHMKILTGNIVWAEEGEPENNYIYII